MQVAREPRSNAERTGATRQALLAAARSLFVLKGFAQTSTPEIVASAGLTRGALYHHFRDKTDLLRELLEQEARAVAADIETAATAQMPPQQALRAGSAAYLGAMQVPGRTRLLLVEGPAVLGLAAMRALDSAHAERTLMEGLSAAMNGSRAAGQGVARSRESIGGSKEPGLRQEPGLRLAIAPLTVLLSAAFDRAALAIDAGEDAAVYESTLVGIIDRILDHERSVPSGKSRPSRSSRP
jgi:AcrR family transcriptional regulator